MLHDKMRRTVTYSTILPVILSVLLLLTVATLQASPGPDRAATAKCASDEKENQHVQY